MVDITGFATVAAADGAGTSKQQGSIDVSLEDKHASIDEIEISSQALPTVEIDERTYSINSFSLHADGVTLEYDGILYGIFQVDISLENVGITVSDISINSAE
ncbi:hypothetical protein HYG81_19530 (plasmid) [Natrinema zhouii]|uniref:hypothetical protein n=1 Tax=Natrinema zhouii TaxID=1710539 RepID=UPI001CFFAD34|nr:hypothetical protein [Natrinema zhouii]UHQ98268.1 hypothetical protein HYG81_19530 [Natrinema zhouii]